MRTTKREGNSTQEIRKESVCSMSSCISEQYLDKELCLVMVTSNIWLWEREWKSLALLSWKMPCRYGRLLTWVSPKPSPPQDELALFHSLSSTISEARTSPPLTFRDPALSDA